MEEINNRKTNLNMYYNKYRNVLWTEYRIENIPCYFKQTFSLIVREKYTNTKHKMDGIHMKLVRLTKMDVEWSFKPFKLCSNI